MATGGIHQHARLAASFRGERDVFALPTPGFSRNEPLPASIEAAAEVAAHGIRQAAGDDPVVLLGYSSGGWLAYSTACHLQDLGLGPAAVVLLDTYLPSGATTGGIFDGMLTGLFERERAVGRFDSAKMSAMGRYMALFGRYEPRELTVPVLFIRPADPLGRQTPDGGEWRAGWATAHELVEVPGDHFSIVEDRADSTATAIRKWLG
jgi:thioesterase domain-containing protein